MLLLPLYVSLGPIREKRKYWSVGIMVGLIGMPYVRRVKQEYLVLWKPLWVSSNIMTLRVSGNTLQVTILRQSLWSRSNLKNLKMISLSKLSRFVRNTGPCLSLMKSLLATEWDLAALRDYLGWCRTSRPSVRPWVMDIRYQHWLAEKNTWKSG